MEDPAATVAFDPESELIGSMKQMGNEWEIYKESVGPLKGGRNVTLLNEALKSQRRPNQENPNRNSKEVARSDRGVPGRRPTSILVNAGNCADSEVIYRFLEANQIRQTKSAFYMAYALHMKSKNKLKKADEIFNLGIARKAEPCWYFGR